jgi:flavin reductase (DIM6/NTAB) family NADH-FMN oxidoreductase RutF
MSSKPQVSRAINADLFRRACAKYPTGITIVTTLDEKGHPHGMTVNSFTSVSLDPPLVLVSIDRRNALLGHFTTSAFFAVNVLGEDQRELSHRFAHVAEGRFHGVEWTAADSGAPLLTGTIAHLDCAVLQSVEVGDHAVLIGEVRAARYENGAPLVYFDSAYRRLER